MRLSKLIILLLICAITKTNAQSTSDYNAVDSIALSITRVATKNTEGLSKYFNEKFTKPEDKVRAIFVWLADNIQYDIDNIFAINRYATTAEIISKTLTTRKAICQGYAETFQELCKLTGIKSFVVTGYTKQSGFVDYIPHAWATAYINNQWRLYDPTWGSGYIKDAKFTKHCNNRY